MVKIFLVLLLLVTSQVSSACEKDLLGLLATAKNTIIANFKKGEPCYNAALIGRSNGLPGCFPPAALKVKSLLAPIFKRAGKVCQNSCTALGKGNSCRSLITQDNLVQLGIEGMSNRLRNKGLTTASSDTQEPPKEPLPVGI
jgi:hypothetical protein